MPPRKRTKLTTQSTPLRESQPKTPTSTTPLEKEPTPTAPPSTALANDPWTDEEETLLFKSLVRWKPTGVQKHFHMFSIFENFRSNGFASGRTHPPSHIRIPGIWRKLRELYDLEALDQRENVHSGIVEASDGSEEGSAGDQEVDGSEEGGEGLRRSAEFRLPVDDEDEVVDFGGLMFQRRFRGESQGPESPPLIQGLNQTRSIPGVKLTGEMEDDEEEDEEEGSAEEENDDEGSEQQEDEEEEAEEKPAKKGARSKPPAKPKTARKGSSRRK